MLAVAGALFLLVPFAVLARGAGEPDLASAARHLPAALAPVIVAPAVVSHPYTRTITGVHQAKAPAAPAAAPSTADQRTAPAKASSCPVKSGSGVPCAAP